MSAQDHSEKSLPDLRVPMEARFEDSLMCRWLSKPVKGSLVLDDMAASSGWSVEGIGELDYTSERSLTGSRSLRFRTSMRDEAHIRANIREGSFEGGQGGETKAILSFSSPQDWSEYNRIALWVWVHPTSMQAYSFYLGFRCQGAPTGATAPPCSTFVQDLAPGEWNPVVWEIAHLRRDRVTQLIFGQVLRGHEPEDEGIVTYDIDRIEIQLVDPDPVEGWEVAPGRVAFHHVGYRPDQEKRAFSSGITAAEFEVVSARTGEAVATFPVQSVANERGSFQILDFSGFREPGEYLLRAGEVAGRSFRIDEGIWKGPVRKAINFFYCERCGHTVPGIHRVCHRDWQGERDGVRKIINGGWHDAGDLSQGSFRTGMAVYAMMEIVARLAERGSDPGLEAGVLEEALWGLEWLLKTRFGDGYRITWSTMRIYTDCRVGTIDDVVAQARNTPWESFLFAAVAALSFRVLKARRPELAEECLKAAREDWEAAERARPAEAERSALELAWAVVSSAHLYRETGESRYARNAETWGRRLLQCQEQRFVDGIPLAGYFYEDTTRQAIQHYYHAAFEESPLLALVTLCDSFPEHEDWMKWYGAALLHSEYYLKRGAGISGPYDLLPGSLYRKSEILREQDLEQRAAMLRQFEEGARLSEEYALRVFPIWKDGLFHGNTAVHLSATLALMLASRLRSDLEGERLVDKQLAWVFGANPFSQSLMYGEGYDFAPQFAYCQRDMVGALPVGMDCLQGDRPFWSGTNYATAKEIWVVPVSRFLWIMASAGMSAFIEGACASDAREVCFEDLRTGYQTTIPVRADSTFRASLPAGDYRVLFGRAARSLKAISGGSYHLRLDPGLSLDFEVTASGLPGGVVRLEATARGAGSHRLAIRVLNGTAADPERTLDLEAGDEARAEWHLKVSDPDSPWAAVIVPDGDLTWKREITGIWEG